MREHRRLSLLVACAAGILPLGGSRNTTLDVSQPRPFELTRFLSVTGSDLNQTPTARLNILCAQKLTDSTVPTSEACLSTVSAWSKHVQLETERHLYRFRRNPADFENSEGFFKMLMLTVVLAEDFGVHYSPERKAEPGQAARNDGFFSNPDDVFLTGLLGPKRQGTCSSMPVLYVAIGRELGYPLKLVTTKGHMFVRWEGHGERFNVEATARGLCRFDDDYYRHWPFEITPEEEAAEGYLKSLTPAEELAAFLSIRGMCLREQSRTPEAIEAFSGAARLAPGCRGYRTLVASLQKDLERTAAYSRTVDQKF